MSTEPLHVTSSRVFNNNNRKNIARNCVQHNKYVFRVELDESQCKCVSVSVSFPFFFLPLLVLPYSFFLLPDPVEGMLPLLERLFGVKGHDCFLSCLAFRQT